jgi:hypothetical protein
MYEILLLWRSGIFKPFLTPLNISSSILIMISIAWDAYVQELAEAKLRALGVTTGDEEPVVSPVTSAMSRKPSVQQYPPLPFSPPLPSSSAASSHANHPNPFSPALVPGAGLSTSQSSNPGSIASPSSMHSQIQGKYNTSRQSVSFTAGEHPFGSPFQYPQQPSPGMWSPQQLLLQQNAARGGSPSLQQLGPIISPSPTFPQENYFQQDVASQMQQRQQLLQNQLLQQQPLQLGAMASPRLPEVSEVEETASKSPSKSPSKTPEARQIKLNPSASLQEEIDDAEYHLEKQFERQLEHDDYSPHSEKDEENGFAEKPTLKVRNGTPVSGGGLAASRFAIADSEDITTTDSEGNADDSEDGPVLHHPQPHSRGHSLSQRPFQDIEDTSSAAESKSEFLKSTDTSKHLSDVETNPSNLGTPIPELSANGQGRTMSISSNPWADSANKPEDSAIPPAAHSRKSSTAKLNVAAKEFKFDPTSTFKPAQFSFNQNSIQYPVAAFPSFAPPMSATSSHFSNRSVSSGSKINFAAPAFIPGHSDFNFSASGPTFRPDAPAFTPMNFSTSVGSGTSGSEGPRIFGDLDLSHLGISKPSKKSKAIPIVRPDSIHSKGTTEEPTEDKDGRITQGEGRFKRARGEKDDGDSVPLFSPSMPLGETSREQSPPKETKPAVVTQADKENSAPGSDGQETAPEIPAKSHSRNPTSESQGGSNKDFNAFEFPQQKQAEEFNAARPFTSRRYASGLPGYGFVYGASSDEKASPAVDTHAEEEKIADPPKKAHKKNSLSATAKPFEFRPGTFNFTFGQSNQNQPTQPVRPAEPAPAPARTIAPAVSPTLPKTGGLAASRYARSPTPPAVEPQLPTLEPEERPAFQEALPLPESPSTIVKGQDAFPEREPTFEEIDAVMRHLNETEMEPVPSVTDVPKWRQPSPTRRIQIPEPDKSSPIRLQPQTQMRSDAPSPSPGRFHALPGETNVHRIFSREFDDPFVVNDRESPIHHLKAAHNQPASDWDDVLSETEEAKLQPRARFFDSHVNDLVGGLLDQRLNPLEKALETIQLSLEMMAARAPSSRRGTRSISGALSDADDEDDEEDGPPRRSLSPRRDKRLEKIRTIVNEALAAHQSRPQTAEAVPSINVPDTSATVLQKLEEMKEQFGESMRLDLRGEDLKNIVEEAVEKRMPTPRPDDSAAVKEAEYQSRITDLEERLRRADSDHQSRITEQLRRADSAAVKEAEYQSRVTDLEERLRRADKATDEEIQNRRTVEEQLAEIQRQLRVSSEEETRLREANQEAAMIAEAEFKSRITDLEERFDRAQTNVEDEIVNRRAAEDRLAEVQRLLRISSEEETRLREAMDEREVRIRSIVDESDAKVRAAEESRAKTTMKIALLEAAQGNATKTQTDLQNRISVMESDTRTARQEAQQWQMKAERALETVNRYSEDAEQATEENKQLRMKMEALRTQMEESIRVREGMRGMLTRLQEDMAQAARDMALENAQHAKKEAELLAHQEVLEAKLQAEARTRERFQMEIERLEDGEKSGMRAVNECKRLEALVAELREENHLAHKDAMRYEREFEEARESSLSELQRTRNYMQAEVESANNHVNVVREDLEAQLNRLRAELDSVRLEADTASQKHDMLLEEANSSKTQSLEDLQRKHENEIEDIQTNYERRLNNTLEDAQRSEQHLLERLSLSSSKTEHLQERVAHLEERLEVAKEAANAAAAHAKVTRSASNASAQPAPHATVPKSMELPEKISPQALRESIMVLQEQLQDREQSIEKMEATIVSLDPESAVKIQKRDDEILWLRELLAVRKSDLTELVSSLESENYDAEQVKDAAIRLKANLQMEEQERERAMNGGSALNLPNIAASLRDAATPRVAQAVGPLAAAWGNWRKTRADSNLSDAGTPRRNNSPGSQSFLAGLLTPPASSLRTPPSGQPTAFGSTGQRFTSAQLANRPRNMTPRARDKLPMRGSPKRNTSGGSAAAPTTPPMMRKSSYDADARATEIGELASDAGFFDDDADADDSSIYGGNLR